MQGRVKHSYARVISLEDVSLLLECYMAYDWINCTCSDQSACVCIALIRCFVFFFQLKVLWLVIRNVSMRRFLPQELDVG